MFSAELYPWPRVSPGKAAADLAGPDLAELGDVVEEREEDDGKDVDPAAEQLEGEHWTTVQSVPVIPLMVGFSVWDKYRTGKLRSSSTKCLGLALIFCCRRWMLLPLVNEHVTLFTLFVTTHQRTLMQALYFTLSSWQQWAAAVVFAFRFSEGGVLFPVWHAEAALAEAASVLWWVAEGRLGAGAAIFYGWMGWVLKTTFLLKCP